MKRGRQLPDNEITDFFENFRMIDIRPDLAPPFCLALHKLDEVDFEYQTLDKSDHGRRPESARCRALC